MVAQGELFDHVCTVCSMLNSKSHLDAFFLCYLQKKKRKRLTPRALPPPPASLPQPQRHHPTYNPYQASGDSTQPCPLPSPLPYTEETWMYPHGGLGGNMGAGMMQPETYIEQHIVRRFSIPMVQGGGGAMPMPFPLHSK